MSDQEIYLTPDAARRVSKAVKAVERMTSGSAPGQTQPRVIPYDKLGITTTAITARLGTTPGYGSVQPYTYDAATNKLVSRGPVEKILNWTGTAISATPVWVEFAVIDGYLWLVGQDCSGVTP